MAERPSLWVFVAIAAAMALIAFGLGQLVEGAGMMFVAGVTLALCGVSQKLRGKWIRG